jgi:hypothetical protein
MKKIYKLYLFGDLIYKSNDLLIIQSYKNTFKEELKKYLIIK